MEIFSDTSLTGWGAASNGQKTHGFWNQLEQKLHINNLELIAAFLALKCFASEERNCEILLRIDNTTAISYINRLGGIKFKALNKIAKQIWQWAETRHIWLFASYIPSRDNKDADKESRRLNIHTEWELNNRAFTIVTNALGQPTIDLFASRINAKCKTYCSWQRDPESFAIDAFTISWNNSFFNAFRPFLRCLRKVVDDKAEGIVIVPLWPAQPWFPLFTKLLTQEPVYFRPAVDLLLSPCRSVRHPLCDTLTLAAGRLSGKRTKEETYQNSWRIF